MSSTNFFFIFIPILSIILLAVNFILAPHKPNKEKKTPFECGYHSFLSQSRKEFSISFFIHALLFLVLDLEIVMTYPYSTSMDANEIYGLTFLILFASLITIGFVYELGIGALKFETKENSYDSFIKKQNIVKKTSNILPSSIYFYLEKYKGPITLFFFITVPLKVISFNLISLFWLAPYIAVICSFMLYIYIQCSDFKPINKNVMIERVLISLAYFFSISLGFAFLSTQTESFYILFSMHIAFMWPFEFVIGDYILKMNSNSNTSGSNAGNGNGEGGSGHQPPHSNGNGTPSSSRKETFEDLWKDLVNDPEEFRTRDKLTTQEQAFVREGDFKSSEYISTRTSASIQRSTRIVNSLGYNYDTMHELFRREICKKMHLISVSKSSGDTQVAEKLAGKLIKNMEKRDINGFLRKKK